MYTSSWAGRLGACLPGPRSGGRVARRCPAAWVPQVWGLVGCLGWGRWARVPPWQLPGGAETRPRRPGRTCLRWGLPLPSRAWRLRVGPRPRSSPRFWLDQRQCPGVPESGCAPRGESV